MSVLFELSVGPIALLGKLSPVVLLVCSLRRLRICQATKWFFTDKTAL